MMRKIFLQIIALTFFCLGFIGLFFPILPTTPFVLLGAGCISAANPQLYSRLENTKYFGEYIKCYKEKKPITLKTRIISLVFLWGTLSFSALFAGNINIVIILLSVGVAVSIHILIIGRKKGVNLNDNFNTFKN